MSSKSILLSNMQSELSSPADQQEDEFEHSASTQIRNSEKQEQDIQKLSHDCKCGLFDNPLHEEKSETEKEDIFKKREDALRADYEVQMETEIAKLKEKFDLIIQNEQIRSTCLLREAHRERQEKIAALKTQLECKNLAGLMYVMCAERKSCRLEKMRIMEEYNNYILTLHQAIAEGQGIVCEMARGYKTAAIVDAEWREKTQKIIEEFQMFIEHYFGSHQESSKFFFNLPELLKICAPLDTFDEEELAPSEEASENESKESEHVEDTWWSKLQTADKPFVVFGDMADFTPNQRRQLLKHVKEEKSSPPDKWKEYAFNNKFLRADCINHNFIKDEYLKYSPKEMVIRDNSQGVQTLDGSISRRITTYSTDMKNDMGSILKIVTNLGKQNQVKSSPSILGARDSFEIASSSKVHEKMKKKSDSQDGKAESRSYSIELCAGPSIDLCAKPRKTSIAPDVESRTVDHFYRCDSGEESSSSSQGIGNAINAVSHQSKLGNVHDSLTLVSSKVHEETDRVGYEKDCPVEECQRKHVNSFLRSLPPYMQFTSPYRQYELAFDDYEPCTKEQLEKLLSCTRPAVEPAQPSESASLDLQPSGVFVQTSDMSLGGARTAMPECTCHLRPPTPRSDVFDNHETSKKVYNHVTTSQFFDENIEFDRFKVIGQESNLKVSNQREDFTTHRANSIVKILKKHPSLCNMFQTSVKS